nr:BMP family ABC transporter substrate-binding protein [Pseudovibrio stylochi]
MISAACAAFALNMTSVLPSQAKEPLKVGFVYVGPISDHGWSYQHDQARIEVEKYFGDKIKTSFIESVSKSSDAERAIERLARSGYELIFATSFSHMNPTIKVARKFPRVKFETATGYKLTKNVAPYGGRFYEGRFVIGQLAAKVSKTGVAGYIAPFAIPEVIRGMNAFVLGARTVNPDFQIKPVWVNSWYDPGREADAAKALIDQGVDIMVQHTDSPAPLQVAQERGIKGFGQASDMSRFAPDAQITAIVDYWGAYYKRRIQAVLDGNWKAENTWGGFNQDMVHMAPVKNVNAELVALAKDTQKKISDGKIVIFKGPLKRQDGTVFLKDGEVATDKQLLEMNFFLEGMKAPLPN